MRKSSYLLEELFEKDVHIVSDSIFKRLKFDFLSSDTVSNQKIKIKNCFLWLRISGDQTNPWKSIITKYYNEK